MEKPELYFLLLKEVDDGNRTKEVEDVDIWLDIISAVPNVWGWKGCIDGELYASMRLIQNGSASRDLWLELGDFGGGFPFTVSASDKTRDIMPDMCSLFIDKKNPSRIRFDKAGYLPRNKSIPFETAKKLALYYVARGYRGELFFSSEIRRGDFSKPIASCHLRLESWEGARYPEIGRQQPRVRLQWLTEFDGSREDVEPIEAVCRKHGLRQYELMGAGDYYRKFERQLELPFEENLKEPIPTLMAAE